MGVYQDPRQAAALKEAFTAAGKKLEMGKSCVRFKTADDLPIDAIGRLIAGTSVDEFIARHEANRAGAKGGRRKVPGGRRGGAA